MPADTGLTPASCRLSVLLAPAAPRGVILRRGPTRWVQLVTWDTATDTFRPGQWFHGRVYERRCDLSPDGSLFLYFASKFDRRTLADREYTYAWTAVSKPPYFTALALWPKGDCWHGGGLFASARHVWLNHRPERATPHPKHLPRGLVVVPNPEACGEDFPVYSRRMSRDGWVLKRDGVYAPAGGLGWRTEQAEVWERPGFVGGHVLCRRTDAISFTTPGGPYIESFRLLLAGGGEASIPDASWADRDQAGRLVFARGGKLFAGEVAGGQLAERELTDLSANQPERVVALPEAVKWDW